MLFRSRTAKSVRLTDAGRAFLSDARALLQQADLAVKKARAIAGAEPTELKLGYSPAATARILPAILRAYQRARLPSQLGLQSSALLGQVEELPRKKPRARSGDGIPPEFCDENLIWPD